MEYKGRYLIIGPPGTGKTYRVAQSVTKICNQYTERHGEDAHRTVGLPAAVCSLTKTAATEAAGRIRQLPGEAVGTLHSFAYRSLDRPALAEALAGDFNSQHPEMAISGVATNTDENPFGEGPGGQMGDKLCMEYHRRRAAKEPMEGAPMKVRQWAVVWEDFKAKTDSIDFTDMIELAMDSMSCPGLPGVILADEAQDHSQLELDLLFHWARSAQALVLVGDPWQSLYEWRGAAPTIFFDEDVPADHQNILAQSYRVPRAVHRVAVGWMKTHLHGYRQIDYAPRDTDGSIHSSQGTWGNDPDSIVQRARECLAREKSVMIAGSCGYMLNPTIARLREAGLPFSNPWRKANGRWNPLGFRTGVTMTMRLTAFLHPLTGVGMHDPLPDPKSDFDFGANVTPPSYTWTMDELAAFTEHLNAKECLRTGGKGLAKSMGKQSPNAEVSVDILRKIFNEDRVNFLRQLMAGEVGLPEASRWLFELMLKQRARTMDYVCKVARNQGADAIRSKPQLFIGTIHSFKGAEADCVILLPDVSPEAAREWSNPLTHNRVVRMFYVGMTRAKEELHICNPNPNHKGSYAVPLLPGGES